MALYVVATPIGNQNDITARALETLKNVDLILCEDTRHSGQLLHNYQIKKPLLAFHEHNEVAKIPEIIEKLKQGVKIALISDAGTPLISDPGFKLVRTAQEEALEVRAVPGPAAITAALSIAGLPTDKFLFVGYLPKTAGKKNELLKKLRSIRENLPMSLVFYESPHRITKTLQDLAVVFPTNQISLQRELTKVHEEVISGKVSEIAEKFKDRLVKGEITLIIY